MGGDSVSTIAPGLPNIIASIHGGAGDTFNTPSGSYELKSASSAWNFSYWNLTPLNPTKFTAKVIKFCPKVLHLSHKLNTNI